MSTQPRILLVEDDDEQAALFAQVLSLAGYDVVAAMTAEDAQALLETSSFALVLADWDLPGMQGDELITTIRGKYPGIRTILYSNHAHVEEACVACGADAWFRKTEGIVRLREVVRQQLTK